LPRQAGDACIPACDDVIPADMQKSHAFLFADCLAGLPPAVIDVPVGVPRQIKKAKYRGYP